MGDVLSRGSKRVEPAPALPVCGLFLHYLLLHDRAAVRMLVI